RRRPIVVGHPGAGFIPITATGVGRATLRQIVAPNGLVAITAGGAVIDGNGPANNVTSAQMVLVAGAGYDSTVTDPNDPRFDSGVNSGIGTQADAIETQVGVTNAQAGQGGIWLANAGNFALTDLGILAVPFSSTSSNSAVTINGGDGD